MARVFIILLFALVALFGCVGAEFSSSNRVSLDFKGSQYNDISNDYKTRMTWGVLYSRDTASLPTMLEIRVDSYGQGAKPAYIDTSNVQRHINAVDKYLKWATLAEDRQEMINKDIDEIDTEYLSGFTLYYSIYSGNPTSHYLVLDQASASFTRGINSIYFDKSNALKLKDTLIKLRDGELKLDDNESIYN